ncbi:uncharacterized protein METZ01_LOCUS429914 [marine metagenome]|uniref:Uncharacterized protein n=1 Tax=marine metagenome TaxID=408172 RepID=A0A382Y1P3_9ZZZZ
MDCWVYDGGMKKLLVAIFVALLMVGCGEELKKKQVQDETKDDPSAPLAILCVTCGEQVSKKTEKCLQCGHPTPDSAAEQERAGEERKEYDMVTELEFRSDQLLYKIGAEKPLTGAAVEMHPNGKMKSRTLVKDGFTTGLIEEWDPNGNPVGSNFND